MCSIFGTNITDLELVKEIAIEGEIRGTDATGFALVNEDGYRIYKTDKKASDIDYSKLESAEFTLGHTRKTTQGSEEKSQNNHPFTSEENDFILAHNGVIRNDKSLKTYETDIETDSYAIVQQLEEQQEEQGSGLDIEIVKEVCNKLRGSFALSILDFQNLDLYLLRHRNPLNILFEQETGNLVYASIPEMIRNPLGKETKNNNFIGKIPAKTIYKFNLETKEFEEQAEFSPKIKKITSTTTVYPNKNDTFNKKDESFNLGEMTKYMFSNLSRFGTRKSTKWYNLVECDFCGVHYRDDNNIKAGLTKTNEQGEEKNFCAFCWEGSKDTVKRGHKIKNKHLEKAQEFKETLPEVKSDGFNNMEKHSRGIITASSFSKLDPKEQAKYILCYECGLYFLVEDYAMFKAGTQYYCSDCISRDSVFEKEQAVEVV